MLSLVLLTLLLEAAFIFYPMAIHIKKVVLGLIFFRRKGQDAKG